MQTKISSLTLTDMFTDSLIFDMKQSPLSTVPFHSDTDCITRFFADKFPTHFAMHEVSSTSSVPDEYTELHVHKDHHEMNAIISNDALEYNITLGGKTYVVGNNSCVWIPAGVPHSANVIKGTGFFIAMRIEKSVDIPKEYLLPDFRAMYSM